MKIISFALLAFVAGASLHSASADAPKAAPPTGIPSEFKLPPELAQDYATRLTAEITNAQNGIKQAQEVIQHDQAALQALQAQVKQPADAVKSDAKK